MRKVKTPAVGDWAVWKTPEYPFVDCDAITEIDNGWMHTASESPVDPALCYLHPADGKMLRSEVVRLANKRKVSMEMMERRLTDERRRSVLGQLDPKE